MAGFFMCLAFPLGLLGITWIRSWESILNSLASLASV